MKEKALKRMADKLNAAGITWAIGAGWMLTKRGVLDVYHDFDILVAEDDAEKADRILTGLGMKSLPAAAHPCALRASYHFDGADIDANAGMVLARGDALWHVRFDASAVDEAVTVLGAQVPMMYLEDWLVIYALACKEAKVQAITAYFSTNGVKHPERFAQVCVEPLPEDVTAKISTLMEAYKA